MTEWEYNFLVEALEFALEEMDISSEDYNKLQKIIEKTLGALKVSA